MGDHLTEGSDGPATFELVPDAGGRAWYWHRVVAELARRGHATVAVDLPAEDDTADLDRLFPVTFQRRVARERLGITPDELAGGHLVARHSRYSWRIYSRATSRRSFRRS